VCVFEDEKLVGVVTRELLYEKMSGRYGFGLFANRPIRKIMQTEFLVVDESVSVEEAARLAMQRPQKNLYDFITVTKDGDYSGVITIRDLLLHLAMSPVSAPMKRTVTWAR
jgi:CBS domain-containing protein